MARPDASDFAALARSSPWRFSTLRFTAAWSGDPWGAPQVRAWLRRPDLLRVESAAGDLIQIVHEPARSVGVVSSVPGGGGSRRTVALPWWTDAAAPQPTRRPDGLVASRPDRFSGGCALDDPMYQDYFWVAMLDPVELADGRDDVTGAASPGTEIDRVREVEHGGRPAWEARVRPLPAYGPRCSCCSLLRSREVDVAEAAAGAGDAVILADYPEAYRVRLDLGTGVCVATEPIGARVPVRGHEVRIEAVDEPMGDELFR